MENHSSNLEELDIFILLGICPLKKKSAEKGGQMLVRPVFFFSQ